MELEVTKIQVIYKKAVKKYIVAVFNMKTKVQAYFDYNDTDDAVAWKKKYPECRYSEWGDRRN